ncbi:hypothetical protein Nepgr_031778 [Nepenthes gracilis]|uniref:Uncharacterized protein n=1 Tax=Nepenthes gracilis TaxID=150966 RepID=A0AAD3THZ9_NEPGR|nr:hypothetical protein Nepgr_031778 [Nepenthes gracilis]
MPPLLALLLLLATEISFFRVLVPLSPIVDLLEVAADFQNFIVCVEILIAAVGHFCAFPYKEFAPADIGFSYGLMGSLSHALKLNDFCHDTVHQGSASPALLSASSPSEIDPHSLGLSSSMFPLMKRDKASQSPAPDAFLEVSKSIDLWAHAGAEQELLEKCGSGAEHPLDPSVEHPSDASPFKFLDKAPTSKVVRFAPEIMSSEALSCASRCRKMAPCSDICHPIVFCKIQLGLKDSLEAPMDAVPKLAFPPLAPPVDAPAEDVAPSTNGSTNRGVVKGLVCRLSVDSQTPLDDAVSTIDALPISGFCRVLSGPVSLSLSQGRPIRNHDGLRRGIDIPVQDLRLSWPADVDFYSGLDLWLPWIY